jgi:hypothetical protein
MRNMIAVAAAVVIMVVAGMVWGETPKEAVGFFGKATGTVKSAKADGTSFVLTVLTAEPGEKSLVKDGNALVGKELTLGTRMPKKDHVAAPHVEDVAFIKSLKPGMEVTVTIFAVNADPKILRITSPGTVKGAETAPATQK